MTSLEFRVAGEGEVVADLAIELGLRKVPATIGGAGETPGSLLGGWIVPQRSDSPIKG